MAASQFLVTVFGEVAGEELLQTDVLELEFAEDLIKHCARRVEISPFFRHLFGLFHEPSGTWLSLNQKLSEWSESRSVQFRLRFKPDTIDRLKVRTAAVDIVNILMILFMCFN